jgi:hypothetical protein
MSDRHSGVALLQALSINPISPTIHHRIIFVFHIMLLQGIYYFYYYYKTILIAVVKLSTCKLEKTSAERNNNLDVIQPIIYNHFMVTILKNNSGPAANLESCADRRFNFLAENVALIL